MFDKSLYPEMIAQAIQLNDAKTLKTITESAIKSDANKILGNLNRKDKNESQEEFGVEFRDMHTGIHQLLVTDTEEKAKQILDYLKDIEHLNTHVHDDSNIAYDIQFAWDDINKLANDCFEVDFRQTEEGDGTLDGIKIINYDEIKPDIYESVNVNRSKVLKRSEATDTYRVFVKTNNGWEIADATADKDVAVALYNTLNRQFKSGNTKFSEIRLIQPGQADITEAKSITEAKDSKGLLNDLQDALDSIYDCKVENDVLTCTDSDGNYIVVGITDDQPIELYLQVHSKQDVSETVNYLFDGIEPAADFIVAVFTAELAVIIQSREEGDNEIVPKEEIEIKEETKSEDGGTVASLGTPPILPAGQVSTIIQEDEDEKKKNESNNFDYINKQLDLLKDSSKVKAGVDMTMDPPNAPEVDKTPVGFIPVQPVEPLQAQDLLTSIATLALGAIEVDDDQAVAMIIESYKDLDSAKLKAYISEAKANNIEPLIGYIYETVNKNEGSNYAFESTSQKSEDTFKDPQLNNSRDVATNTTASGNDKPTPALADDIDPAPTEVEDFPKLKEPVDRQSDEIAKSTDTADIS